MLETLNTLLTAFAVTIASWLGAIPEPTLGAQPALTVPQGGTGWSNIQAGAIPYGTGSALRLATTSTTTVSCAGTASCSTFTVFGSSPVTITGSGGSGSGLSTTSPVSAGNVLVYSATGAGSAFGAATTTLTASTPLSLSQPIFVIGGSASALSLDTSGTWTGNAGTATALTANGANCSAGNAPLGVDASGAVESCFDVWTEAENTSAGYVASTRALTVAGTANQVTSSAGSQTLAADRTWTLSLPNHVIFPSSFFATNASTTNATSTNFTTDNLYAGTSAGVIVRANNGTDVAILGAGNTSNATFYGGVNIDGTTRLATSLSGLAQLTSGTVSAVTGTTGQFPYYSGTDTVTATSTIFVDTASEVGIGNTSPGTNLDVTASTALTNTIKDVLYLRHNTSGTPATSWGVGFGMYGDSATVDNREMFRLTTKWRTATDATRSTYTEAYGYNNGGITKMFQWGRASATFETLGNDSVTTVLSAGSSQNIINANSTTGNVSKLTLFSENTLRAAWLGSQNNSLYLGTGNSAATVLTIASTTNSGFGEEVPGSKLSISGNATVGASYDRIAAPTNGLLVEAVLGIGTTTPKRILTISSSTAPQIALTDASLTSDQWNFRAINGNFYLATSSPSTFSTSTIPAFVITSTGNVGVGTSTPWGRMSVTGTDTSTTNALIVGNSDNTPLLRVQNNGTTTISGISSATSTVYGFSTASGKGATIILEDTDGAGCTEIYALNGVLTAQTVTCPAEN